MFLTDTEHTLDAGHLDLSFDRRENWNNSEHGFSGLGFSIGDPERGPLAMMVAIPTKPGDEEMFPPIIHMHRSDSFRTIFNGDLIVGRSNYSDGQARLQGAGDYYGPEQPGAEACKDSKTVCSLLVFGDRRGYKPHSADRKYDAMHEKSDAAAKPMFARLGISETLPEDSSGHKDIRTNIGTQLKAGFADISFDDRDQWPAIGAAKTVAVALGQTDCGPIVLGLSAKAGATALPAATWDTEVVIALIHGSCEIEGVRYAPGDVRVQKAGVAQGAVVAGPEGVDLYVLLGDRRGALPKAAADAAWARQISDVIQAFSKTPANA